MIFKITFKMQILFSQPVWKDNKIGVVLTKSKQKFIFDSLLDCQKHSEFHGSCQWDLKALNSGRLEVL